MNAVDLLISHHRELEGRFKKLMDAKPPEQGEFNDVADSLAAHITVEEELFYPAVKAERTEDILLESLEEHLSLKRVLADLLALTPADEKFEPKLHVLVEQAEHHHKEEEEHLFPKVKKMFSSDRLDKLGSEMKQRMDHLSEVAVRKRVPQQTADSTTLA
ncbi:MAG: hemerythrin domain-containing protein [Myxococcota bacterium]|nr:hemerythrin domain-containing protein [Myxococcota bacterium]